MVATAPTKSVASFHIARGASAPDLAYFRQRYPETVTNLGVLPRREEWLRRIWELETHWQSVWETRGGEALTREVVVRGAPPAGREAEGEFDVIYAGGASALLHEATVACAHGRRVLFISVDAEGSDGGNWNLSDVELRGLEASGVVARGEGGGGRVDMARCRFV